MTHIGNSATSRTALASMHGGSEGRWRLAFDEDIGAPRGGTGQCKVRDFTLAVVPVAGTVLLVTKVDRAGGDCGRGIAPCTHAYVVSVMVIATITKAVSEEIDRLAGGGKGIKCGFCGGNIKAEAAL